MKSETKVFILLIMGFINAYVMSYLATRNFLDAALLLGVALIGFLILIGILHNVSILAGRIIDWLVRKNHK